MKSHEAILFNHKVVYYVPCYQTNPPDEPGYPSFTYRMEEATSDEQMAWSMKPDYVLKLTGTFNAKTQPFSEEVYHFNRGVNTLDDKTK